MLEATSGSFADGAFVCNGKEDDISQCTGYTGKTVASCSSQQAIAINCRKSNMEKFTLGTMNIIIEIHIK
ncbi:hypothetical protein DPMN_035952 [Dreissena polymorpha]|uniref:Uncharacterized protein n=1 Tax=Dreissena polymorpha TaxID=45954 RepID=A0A9D4MBH8_DREPO|nr:hypothetical protein DPMN_035884 [Dreissena polymorpha]KAH3872730.1 hypothetical protein DPMN_035952 [Dreissena polymorpha]